MKINLKSVVLCKHCGHPEYYGEMRWLAGRYQCRKCYKHHYEEVYGERYQWHDLDGVRPTMEEYLAQKDIDVDEGQLCL